LPGTYRQAFRVDGDDVTIKGSGPATVITWPATFPDPAPCNSEAIVCVTGNRDRVTNLRFDLGGPVPSECPAFCGGLEAPIPDGGPTTGTTLERVAFTGDGNPMVFGALLVGRDVTVGDTRTSQVYFGLVVVSEGGTVAHNSARGDCAAISVSDQGTGLARDVVVEHNRIEAPQACATDGGAGIVIEDAPGTVVEDNRINGIDAAILVVSSSVSPNEVVIRDNQIVDSCQGVVAAGPSGVEVRNNRITGTVAPPCFLPAVGVYLAAPDTTVADNKIRLTVDTATHLFDGTPGSRRRDLRGHRRDDTQ
jgi:hypothetical protein